MARGLWIRRTCLAALAVCSAAAAEEGARESRAPFEAGGSLRTLFAGTANYDSAAVFGAGNDADAVTRSLLRVTASGSPAEWLALEIHAVESLDFTTAPSAGMPGAASGGAGARYRMADADWDWAGEEDLKARLWLDRFAVTVSAPWGDFTAGRQAITFGKAYFWNPLDVFLAFDPREFDREYKGGVDGARIDVPLGAFSGASLVAVGGRAAEDGGASGATWRGSALLARLNAGIGGFDLAAQAGKVCGGYQAGLGASGELGPVEVRLEGTHTAAMSGGGRTSGGAALLDDHAAGVAGIGRRLTPKLLVEAEYLYNGAATGDLGAGIERVMSGNALHVSRNVAGVMASYELHALLAVQAVWLGSLSDGSGLAQPGLVYSVSDEAEFLAGAQLAWGHRPATDPGGIARARSEFGTYPHYIYGQYKFYF